LLILPQLLLLWSVDRLLLRVTTGASALLLLLLLLLLLPDCIAKEGLVSDFMPYIDKELRLHLTQVDAFILRMLLFRAFYSKV
jgi:hypothetical protein